MKKSRYCLCELKFFERHGFCIVDGSLRGKHILGSSTLSIQYYCVRTACGVPEWKIESRIDCQMRFEDQNRVKCDGEIMVELKVQVTGRSGDEEPLKTEMVSRHGGGAHSHNMIFLMLNKTNLLIFAGDEIALVIQHLSL